MITPVVALVALAGLYLPALVIYEVFKNRPSGLFRGLDHLSRPRKLFAGICMLIVDVGLLVTAIFVFVTYGI